MMDRIVCILTSVHSAFDVRIFHKEAKTLRENGYNILLLAQHHKEENVDGIHIIPLPVPHNRFERMTKTAWKLFRLTQKKRAEVYHFHDPELIPLGLLLKRQGKKVIYDIHEDVPKQILSKPYLPHLLRKPISMMLKTMEAISTPRFNCVVTATPSINERFLSLGANAVSVNNYPLADELYSSEKLWERREKAVCYIGGISGIRGAFEMVEAIEKTECKLLLAGDFETGLEGKLKRMPGWQKVITLGYVGRDIVRATMARSWGGLLLYHPVPNHMSAQPNKLFEYMSAGIPVITSDFPLWKKIVEETECGICVNPFSTEQIANAIRWIIEHPIEAQAMGENGRQAVLRKYNWENESRKLLLLYKEVINQ
jgi:glycosyltransferase involved in cell wall biosynthesis